MFRGLDYSSDTRPSYLVLQVHDNKQAHSRSISWSEHNPGAAAEADTIGDQQLKQMQLGCAMVWPHETSARQRHYCTRVLVRQSRGIHQTRADMVKQVRPQKHNYVCSKERTVVCCTESSSDLCTMKSCRCRTADIVEWGAVAEASKASELHRWLSKEKWSDSDSIIHPSTSLRSSTSPSIST